MHFRIVQSMESLDEIHSCLLRILMWNYQSKVNYLCVKLRAHLRVFRKTNAGSGSVDGMRTLFFRGARLNF